MKENSGKLLGFYNEMSAFLTQINLYRGRGLSDLQAGYEQVIELPRAIAMSNGTPIKGTKSSTTTVE